MDLADSDMDRLEADLANAMRCHHTTAAMIRVKFEMLSVEVRCALADDREGDAIAKEVSTMGKRVANAIARQDRSFRVAGGVSDST